MDEAHTGAAIHGRPEAHLTGRAYLLTTVAIAVLTLIAVGIAYSHGAPLAVLAIPLLIIAAGGVALELLYFMHLRVSPERRLFFAFFGAGLVLALLMGTVLTILLQIVIPAK